MRDDGYIRCPATVTIRRASDGAEIKYRDEHFFYNLDIKSRPFCYQWTDGNYGCDCNRGIFFHDREVGDDGPCTTGKYFVPSAVTDDGVTVLIDNHPLA